MNRTVPWTWIWCKKLALLFAKFKYDVIITLDLYSNKKITEMYALLLIYGGCQEIFCLFYINIFICMILNLRQNKNKVLSVILYFTILNIINFKTLYSSQYRIYYATELHSVPLLNVFHANNDNNNNNKIKTF